MEVDVAVAAAAAVNTCVVVVVVEAAAAAVAVTAEEWVLAFVVIAADARHMPAVVELVEDTQEAVALI